MTTATTASNPSVFTRLPPANWNPQGQPQALPYNTSTSLYPTLDHFWTENNLMLLQPDSNHAEDTSIVTDAYFIQPASPSKLIPSNIMVTADDFGGATATIECSADGVSNFFILNDNLGNPMTFTDNGLMTLPNITNVFIRANVTGITGSTLNLSVLIC